MDGFNFSVMKVLGLISSPTEPASRARIVQYEKYLKQFDVLLTPKTYYPLRDAAPPKWTYTIKKLTTINPWRQWNVLKLVTRLSIIFQQNNYDIIWQNRLILPQHYFIEPKLKKPVVFDFDDAIWMIEGAAIVEKAIQNSTMIFAGNDYLASYAAKYNKNVVVVPSTVDTSILTPLEKKISFTLGWIGSPSNFNNLEMIKEPVLEFLRIYSDSKLTIVSSEVPACFHFDNKRIEFKKWSAENENQDINDFSVGLMPLLNNEWSLGKCSYKMLQYMSCGKPVVVSPVGNNHHILKKSIIGKGAVSNEDWLNAFIVLKEDKDYYFECAKNARVLACSEYDTLTWSKKIAEFFHSLV
jgi:glycosyltransferase involved in cell wall biosynthesis